jgi:hypothetical protein
MEVIVVRQRMVVVHGRKRTPSGTLTIRGVVGMRWWRRVDGDDVVVRFTGQWTTRGTSANTTIIGGGRRRWCIVARHLIIGGRRRWYIAARHLIIGGRRRWCIVARHPIIGGRRISGTTWSAIIHDNVIFSSGR